MSPVVKARSTGFTLIELLVTIFIIGILLAATLTIVPKVKRAVYGTQTQAQLSAIAAAIQQYYNDFRAYPGPLPNSQLVTAADATSPPYIVDPNNLGNTLSLAGATPSAPAYTNTAYVPASFQSKYITGAQNLTLGLLGGLEVVNTAGAYTFVYNPQDIFTDGVNPSPKGAASLNVTNPKRQQAYIQVKVGDISTPNINYNSGAGASFVDATNDLNAADMRSPKDAMIPVFLDKYADPLPILYYRTNVSGTAIVGFRNLDAPGGQPLQDATLKTFNPNPPPEIAQYDLFQNLAYVTSRIGTIGTLSNNPNSFHGLQGLGTATDFRDLIDTLVNGQYVPTNSGANAIAYFKDPTLNPAYDPTVTVPPCNTHLGVARQKDGYILISAGPDRLYGTHDDLVYPGPLQP